MSANLMPAFYETRFFGKVHAVWVFFMFDLCVFFIGIIVIGKAAFEKKEILRIFLKFREKTV